MIHLIAAMGALLMLALGLGVIALTLRANGTKIMAALIGRSPVGIATPAGCPATPRARSPVRIVRSRPLTQPLRAAA